MSLNDSSLSLSSITKGQAKKKPEKSLAPGVVQRLNLQRPLDVALARLAVRKLSDEVGYSLINQIRISTAIFEIADQLVTFAGQGEIIVFWRENASHKGLEFFCNDLGLHAPQLTDFYKQQAHQPERGTNELSPQRLVDTFEFTEDAKHGNCINMTVWLE